MDVLNRTEQTGALIVDLGSHLAYSSSNQVPGISTSLAVSYETRRNICNTPSVGGW